MLCKYTVFGIYERFVNVHACPRAMYCTCFSVRYGCSGFSVDVTRLDLAQMSDTTELHGLR